MKKKLWLTTLTAAATLCMTFGLSSCGIFDSLLDSSGDYSEHWTVSETEHWRETIYEGWDNETDRGEHTFVNDKCTVCGYLKKFTEGLSFEQIGSDTDPTYAVTGIGEATDTVMAIPAYYNGKAVVRIANHAFENCTNLKGVVIDGCVKVIEWSAFEGCTGLTSVVIGECVESIEDAFTNCSSLSSIEVAIGNKVYHSAGNCVIETAEGGLVFGCKNSVIPTDGSVNSIGYSAFKGCSGLTSIEIPDGVTSIGANAFKGCSGLTSIVISDGVTSIGATAFGDCSSLTSIRLPASLVEIGWNLFTNCRSITDVYYGGSLADWDERFDAEFNFGKSVTIHPNSTSLPTTGGNSGNQNGNSGDQDGAELVASEGLEFELSSSGDSYKVIGIGTCTDSDIVIPATYEGLPVTWIDDFFAVRATKVLTSVVIPDGVTYIGAGAFSGCKNLTYVVIPTSMKTISASAFSTCSESLSIYYKGTSEQWSAINGHNIMLNGNVQVAVPIYYYSETEPTESGNFWYYVDDVPMVW